MAGFFGDWLFFARLRQVRGLAGPLRLFNGIAMGVFGVMTLLVFYGLAIDLVNIAALAIPNFDVESFDTYALHALTVLTVATLVTGFWGGTRPPRIRHVDVPLAKLPKDFEDFRIVQISDLHIGPTLGRGFAQKTVEIANSLHPDIIALTGDFVDGKVATLSEDVEPLADLKAKDGVFFVTGNHEYYSGAEEWIEKFRQLGAQVLINEHVVLARGVESLTIAGVTDLRAGDFIPAQASDPEKALKGSPADAPRILLALQPADYKRSAAAGADLQLSGHAHGGQYFPFTFLIRFFQHFYAGLGRYKEMWIYVNRGTGFWGPPLRTGGPGEITCITLKSF